MAEGQMKAGEVRGLTEGAQRAAGKLSRQFIVGRGWHPTLKSLNLGLFAAVMHGLWAHQ